MKKKELQVRPGPTEAVGVADTPETIDRRTYVGGSDIGTIFGVNSWKSRLELYEEKLSMVVPTYTPQQEKWFRRGKFLEPWALKMLEEDRDIFVVRRNQRYIHPDHAFMSCEVDFEFQADDGIQNGEIKTVNVFAAKDWGEQESDEIPLTYCLQAHYGQFITGRSRTLVAALIGADELRVYEVQRDAELHEVIRHKVLEFWRCVQTKTPPPPVTAGDMNRVLAKLDGYVVTGSEAVWNKIAELGRVKNELQKLKDRKEEIEVELKRYVYMQATTANLDPGIKTWQINGGDGKKLLTVAQRHRSGYVVEPSDYIECRMARSKEKKDA